MRSLGTERVSPGTIYNYLPVNIGDHLDIRRVREAIRTLYATGFFRDVQLRRDGDTLVVVVLERPSIESFEITGNKDIKTEDLQKSLRNVGLAAICPFNRSSRGASFPARVAGSHSRGSRWSEDDGGIEAVAFLLTEVATVWEES